MFNEQCTFLEETQCKNVKVNYLRLQEQLNQILVESYTIRCKNTDPRYPQQRQTEFMNSETYGQKAMPIKHMEALDESGCE